MESKFKALIVPLFADSPFWSEKKPEPFSQKAFDKPGIFFRKSVDVGREIVVLILEQTGFLRTDVIAPMQVFPQFV